MKKIWLVLLLIFFTNQINAQKEIVLKKDNFEVKIVTEELLLKVWVLTKNFKRTDLRLFNPKNDILFKKKVLFEYSVTFHLIDGANGYYRLSLVNKKERMNIYFIKNKSLEGFILKEHLEYLYND